MRGSAKICRSRRGSPPSGGPPSRMPRGFSPPPRPPRPPPPPIRHNIKSRALVTEVVDNVIEDGPNGSSSYLIEAPNGGTVTITGNTLHKGPNTDNPGTAIFLGAEGDLLPSEGIFVADNVFENDGPTITVFVRNNTETPAVLQRNRLQGSVVPLEGPGELIP